MVIQDYSTPEEEALTIKACEKKTLKENKLYSFGHHTNQKKQCGGCVPKCQNCFGPVFKDIPQYIIIEIYNIEI